MSPRALAQAKRRAGLQKATGQVESTMSAQGYDEPVPFVTMLSEIEYAYGYHPDDVLEMTIFRIERLFLYARYRWAREQYDQGYLATLRSI